MYRFLWSFFKNHTGSFIVAVILAAGTLLAGIGLMATSGYLISEATLRPMLVDLFVLTAAVRFFGISRAAIRYLERIVAHEFTFKILLSIRLWFYEELSNKSLKWLMGKRHGDLLSKAVTDIESVQNSYLRVISPALVAILVSAVVFFLLMGIDSQIALSTIFFITLSGIVHSWLVKKRARESGKAEVEIKSLFKIFLVDKLRGLPDMCWLGQKQRALADSGLFQERLDRVQKQRVLLTGINDGISNLISYLGMFCALLLAIPEVLSANYPGTLLAAITLGVLSSFEAVHHLASAIQQNEITVEASKRVKETISSNYLCRTQSYQEASPHEGILLKDVCFSYEEEQIALHDISVVFTKGSKNAIVGPSGSGKSSLVHLILNFWNADSGTVSIAGKPVGAYIQEDLRSQFAVMGQDHYVFHRSLRENLMLANRISESRLVDEALKAVGLFETSQQYEKLNQPATLLSGGERQLLAFAGVLLRGGHYWILDEPSANLDMISEKKLLDLVWENLGNNTLIMITHRLVDMEKMDQIIVMDKGKIVAKGSHAHLLNTCKMYSKMYYQQFELLRD